jgi:hypothetical protein
MAMEAFKVGTCSYFQPDVPPGRSSSCRRGCPPGSPTRLGGCGICSFQCGSKCHQSSPKAWAYRCPTTGDPQHHQVGTANGRAHRSQSGDQDHWTSCQERGQTSWRHTWQGHRECRIKNPPGGDTDGGGGKATVETRGDGMEVVHRPTFLRSEDS